MADGAVLVINFGSDASRRLLGSFTRHVDFDENQNVLKERKSEKVSESLDCPITEVLQEFISYCHETLRETGKVRYPVFECLAQIFLAYCLATAVVERGLSTMGRVKTLARNGLKDASLEQAMVLMHNAPDPKEDPEGYNQLKNQ